MDPEVEAAESVISRQHFADSEWRAIIEDPKPQGCFSISEAFRIAADHIEAGEHSSKSKIFRLLSNVCSMMLSPESVNEPFKPMMVWDGKRTMLPDDLSSTELNFLAEVLDDVDEPRIKARLADLLWLRFVPRNFHFALIAIDAYRTIPVELESWFDDGNESWLRAIGLTRMLGSGAGNRLVEIRDALLLFFDSVIGSDALFALSLSRLLETLEIEVSKSLSIAQRLEAAGHNYCGESNWDSARLVFAASAKWFAIAGEKDKPFELIVQVAEAWVHEAESRISSDQPSHLVAASFYENAVQTYRTIPRSARVSHRVDERIAEILAELKISGVKSLDEMTLISSPSIDISEFVESSRNAVRGKDVTEALRSFANVQNGTRVKKIRADTVTNIQLSPLQNLIAASTLSRDGRVVAKRPGMRSGEGSNEENEMVIWARMIQDYGRIISITVQGAILPGLEILLAEHRLRESDFVYLASASPLVPKGRERLFGKGLYAGFDRDFVAALHLLVPQIEHMVRYHLQEAGVKTSTLDSEGIENENGLSTLMGLEAAESIFGEDLAFEIRALFCDPYGSNLRNELAHGLAGEDVCLSSASVYAWWFALRLTFNSFWNSERNSAENREVTANMEE